MRGYELLSPQSAISDNENNTPQISELYQIIGGIERSARFYYSQYDEELSEITQSVNYPTFVSQGGPTIVLPVEEKHALIAVYFTLDIKTSTANSSAWVALKDSIQFNTSQEVAGSGEDILGSITNSPTSYVKFTATAGKQAYKTLQRWPRGELIVWKAQPGTHTIELTYSQQVAGTGYFRNRKLWGTAI